MKLLVLIGDSAVGKMTVGQELMKITDLRLFHNHMTIEPVLEIFGKLNGTVIRRWREVIFEEFAASDAYGLIFTYMWGFDLQSDWDYIAHVRELFEQHGAEVFYAELVAPQEVRLQRNATENRLKHKASKRDIEISNQRLINDDAKHRCVSNDGEIPFENYIKIDNTNLSAAQAAVQIKERFNL
ncbi:MAG TPA: shikimate kinase [Oscillospiraceae bacterium]|nr:shikimate kinase [Oscillospiraceae bacterium]HPF56062.1 shikimate kinase [Clostridiales bacterium]HPK36142.1 shikimate kinase [Oscillospiraceae bacterium]HPR76713.1 shikimate kinase [Oscillospiraceae bacterium]